DLHFTVQQRLQQRQRAGIARSDQRGDGLDLLFVLAQCEIVHQLRWHRARGHRRERGTARDCENRGGTAYANKKIGHGSPGSRRTTNETAAAVDQYPPPPDYTTLRLLLLGLVLLRLIALDVLA